MSDELLPLVPAMPVVVDSDCFFVLPEPRLRRPFSFLLVVVVVLLANGTGACIEVGVPPVSAVLRTHIASMANSVRESW